MKRLALTVLMLGSTSAFAFIDGDVHHMHGEGKWQDSKGLAGVYEVDVDMKKDGEHAFTVEETYHIGNETKEFAYRLVKTGHNFFNVMLGETQIGDGYCVADDHRVKKVCHWEFSHEGHKGEKTIKVNKLAGTVSRVGSCTDAEHKVVFHDKLRRGH